MKKNWLRRVLAAALTAMLLVMGLPAALLASAEDVEVEPFEALVPEVELELTLDGMEISDDDEVEEVPLVIEEEIAQPWYASTAEDIPLYAGADEPWGLLPKGSAVLVLPAEDDAADAEILFAWEGEVLSTSAAASSLKALDEAALNALLDALLEAPCLNDDPNYPIPSPEINIPEIETVVMEPLADAVDSNAWKTAVTVTGATQTAANRVLVEWKSNGIATQYSVYEQVDGSLVFKTYVDATSATLYNVPDGAHTYVVKPRMVVNGMGVVGQVSNAVTVQVGVTWKTAPQLLSVEQTANKQVTLTWKGNGIAEEYSVYELVDGQTIYKTREKAEKAILYNVADGSHTYIVKPRQEVSGVGVVGEASNSMTIVTPVTPAATWKTAPELISVVQTANKQVTLTWKGNGIAEEYSVYELVDGQTIYKTREKAEKAILYNVADGSHTYIVKPRQEVSGVGVVGEASNSMTITLMEAWKLPATDVTLTQKATTIVEISWKGNGTATQYSVYEVVDGSLVYKTHVSAETTTINGVSLGSHTYVVKPRKEVNGVGTTGQESERKTITVQDIDWKKAVTITELTQTGDNKAHISWKSNGTATQYSVYEVVNGNLVYKTHVSATETDISNLASGEHTFVVKPRREVNGVGVVGDVSEAATITIIEGWKAAPELISVEQTANKQVTLTWKGNGIAEEYSVYELVDGQTVYKTREKAEKAILYNVAEGSHTYIVKPRKEVSGVGVVGEASNEVTITVVEAWKLPATELTLTQKTTTIVEISWKGNGTATQYSVYEVVDGNLIYKTHVSAESTTIGGVSLGSHTYVVKPRKEVNGVGTTGQESERKTIYVQDIDWKQAVEITEITQTGDGKVHVTWTSNGTATQYSVYEVVNGSLVYKTHVNATETDISNLAVGEHTFAVKPRREVNGVGVVGDASEYVTVTIIDGWKIAAVLESVEQTGKGLVTLTWKGNGVATQYSVYEVQADESLVFKGYFNTTSTAVIQNVTDGEHTYVVKPRREVSGVGSVGLVSNAMTVEVENNPTFVEGEFEFQLTEDGTGVIVLAYNGSAANVTIPSKVQGLPVVEIGDKAFYGNKTIVTIVWPNTIIRIGVSAFAQSTLVSATTTD